MEGILNIPYAPGKGLRGSEWRPDGVQDGLETECSDSSQAAIGRNRGASESSRRGITQTGLTDVMLPEAPMRSAGQQYRLNQGPRMAERGYSGRVERIFNI